MVTVGKETEKEKMFDIMSDTKFSIIEEFIEAGESFVCAEIMGNVDQLVVGTNYRPKFQFPIFDGMIARTGCLNACFISKS